MTDRELEIDTSASWVLADPVRDAIGLASDQDQVTWLTENGKRIAAIVPVESAQYAANGMGRDRRTANIAHHELHRAVEQLVSSANVVADLLGHEPVQIRTRHRPGRH